MVCPRDPEVFALSAFEKVCQDVHQGYGTAVRGRTRLPGNSPRYFPHLESEGICSGRTKPCFCLIRATEPTACQKEEKKKRNDSRERREIHSRAEGGRGGQGGRTEGRRTGELVLTKGPMASRQNGDDESSNFSTSNTLTASMCHLFNWLPSYPMDYARSR